MILLLVLVLLCLTGLVLARAFLTDPSPSGLAALVTRTPLLDPIGNGRNQSQITIDPEHGYIGSLITVTGQGWWPGEPVFVFLRSEEEGEGPGYAYAAAVADEQGQFHTALTFPNEVRWIRAQRASSRGCDVIARGTRSELEASTRFSIVAPLPTAVPRGIAVTTPPPTPPPTSLPAHTPTATAAATATTFAAPTATPTPATISDWRGEYFANAGLAGDPVLIRNDLAVGFFWGTDSPGKGVPADRFSVRWTRLLHFAESTYRFAIAADDGVRFWIDGRLLVDDWQDGPLRPLTLDLYLSEDEHTLRVEYYENLGDAGIQFGWEQIALPTATPTPPPTPVLPPTDTPTATPVPTDTPAPTPTPTTTMAPTDTPTPMFEPTATRMPGSTPPAPLPHAWQAQYYANATLSGKPALVREYAPPDWEDIDLDFDWGAGSPGEGVPPDLFSARWTRHAWLPAGAYRFFLAVDDGARLWIDGQLLMDEWHTASGGTYVADVDLSEGLHTLKVEYFEQFLDAQIRLWTEYSSELMSVFYISAKP